MDHIHALSNEDRYRCFVYEKVTPDSLEDVDYRVAQSGDATCNGLFSATEGSRTMILRKGESITLVLKLMGHLIKVVILKRQ